MFLYVRMKPRVRASFQEWVSTEQCIMGSIALYKDRQLGSQLPATHFLVV